MDIRLLSLGDVLKDPVTGELLSAADKHRLTIDVAIAAEEAGLHGFHVGEHHGMEYVIASPPVLLAAIAQHTKTIRLGTGVTLLANLDPVRVAEDYATADILSGGRIEIVGGRGNIFPSMYELMGQPLEESQDRFAENTRLLLELWTKSEVTWQGQFRTPIRSSTIEPTPVQRPHPPVWIGGGLSKASADLAASLGLPLMLPVTTFQPAKSFAPAAQQYRESWEAAGNEGPARIGAVFHAMVGKTSQDAKARWAPRYHAYHDWALKIMESTGTPAPPWMTSGFDYDRLVGPDGSAVAGSPEEVVDRLGVFNEMFDLDVVLLYNDLGGIPRSELLPMVELIGSHVAPRLS